VLTLGTAKLVFVIVLVLNPGGGTLPGELVRKPVRGRRFEEALRGGCEETVQRFDRKRQATRPRRY
jgi:hypothetical protein